MRLDAEVFNVGEFRRTGRGNSLVEQIAGTVPHTRCVINLRRKQANDGANAFSTVKGRDGGCIAWPANAQPYCPVGNRYLMVRGVIDKFNG